MYRHRLVLLYATRKQVPKIKEPNPLNFYSLRRLKLLPNHFEFITVGLTYNIETAFINWIEDNLKSRYYIGKSFSLDNNQVGAILKIGFEDSKELSYFVLACPHLKYK